MQHPEGGGSGRKEVVVRYSRSATRCKGSTRALCAPVSGGSNQLRAYETPAAISVRRGVAHSILSVFQDDLHHTVKKEGKKLLKDGDAASILDQGGTQAEAEGLALFHAEVLYGAKGVGALRQAYTYAARAQSRDFNCAVALRTA